MDRWQAAHKGARAAACGAATLWLAGAAQPTPQQLHDVQQAGAMDASRARDASLQQQAAEAEWHRLASARVAAAAALRSLEVATAEAASGMDALTRRRAEAEARLQARAAQLTPLLPLIERLSLYPAETLLAVPAAPDQALSGLLVLRGLVRQLETEARALRAEQAEVERLTEGMARQEHRLAEAQSAQSAQAVGLDRQIAEAQQRGRMAEDAASVALRRAAEQAGRAETLRAALGQLEAARRQEEARARADAAVRQRQVAITQPAIVQPGGPLGNAGLGEARGQLGSPVAGTVVKAFGEPGDAGPTTGISFGAPPAAHVASPCGGRVVFAGPFRSFGHLMIVDCGGGAHFVLAGLERLDVAVGRPVQAGEPVGMMASWDPRTPGRRPLLYVELREHGQPINPAPYLRVRP